jgi:betaine-aldehyde dehydrogenase
VRAAHTPVRLPESDAFVHATGDEFERLDPAIGALVTIARESTSADIETACGRARGVVHERAWGTGGARRSRVLHDFARALLAHAEELAELLTREQGKTLAEARIEVGASADMVDFYAGLARSVYGRSMSLGPNAHGVVLRDPVGVVAIITPWNWPLLLTVRALAPALAAGNACMVKPASATSGTIVHALRLLATHPELPGGALTCLLGSGARVGDALVGSSEIDMVAFTGDTSTGVHVMQRAAEQLTRVSLELGGKSANLVFADADLDKAVDGALDAILTTTGQVCTAGSRLLVERPIHDAFVDRLRVAMEAVIIGDPLDAATGMGPLVSPAAAAAVRRYVEIGATEGTLITGDRPVAVSDSCELECFVAPALVTDLWATSAVLQEEIFGPMLAVQAFDDETEAVTIANDSRYGLAAGLWTADVGRCWRVGRALQAGTVWINTYHHFYPETEVGGVKHSGVGRQQGLEGLLEFTETKHLNFDGAAQLWG